MPFGSVTLKPGIDTESTATLSRASYSSSNLGRFRAGLFEKLGGWVRYFQFAVAGIPRALQAWQDLNGLDWLAIGTTTTLDVISDDVLSVITPQTKTTDFSPNFATTASSPNVTVTDANIANVTTYDTIEFNTPISVGGLILSGSYPINLILGTSNYRIVAASNATTTRANATITAITAANPGSVTTSGAHGFSSGDLIYISGVAGMTQVNNRLFTITSTGANTFTIGVNTSTYTAYTSGGTASPGSVPFFTTTSGASNVTVTLQDHGLSAGGSIVFPIATTLQSSVVTITNAPPGVVTWFTGMHGMTGGETIVFTTTGTLPTGLTAGTTYYVLAAGITTTTFRVSATAGGAAINTSSAGSGIHTGTVGSLIIQGTYSVVSVTDVDNFVIAASGSAIANSVDPMNSGNAELVYYLGIGPASGSGTGYSFSTYSSGTYSGVGSTSTAQTGTAITATDWTMDNWGSTLLSCPANGGLYQWTPGTGFQNAQLVSTAPVHNGGIFVATPYQILISWGTTVEKDIGVAQDPLAWAGSDLLDYTYWGIGTVNPSTGIASQAYQNRIPTGSAIKAGLAASRVLLWTDLDLWELAYLQPPLIWGQNKIGSNCGTVGRHSVAQMAGVVYWWGPNNFYALAGGSPVVIPCSVWDIVFQNLDRGNLDKCWVETVTSFSEVWFFYPSASGGTGQCDSYAKVNVLDGSWDYGSMPRSAGIDQSVLGNPIMATPTGVIYTHESGYDADSQPLIPAFTTGAFYLAEGEDFAVIDAVYPDFKLNLSGGSAPSAIVQITFYVTDYPGDTPRSYGPYSMSTTTQKLDVRFRGRQVIIAMTSTDIGSWWRLGKVRFRFATSGRR